MSEIIKQSTLNLFLDNIVDNISAADIRLFLENVWDYHFDPQTNVIDVHMSRLRKKIDKQFSFPLINTVRGAGYVIKVPEKNQK